MANSYIQIRDETMSAGKYKRISVLWNDFSEGPVSQQLTERAANGNLLVSIGKTYRIWRGVFKIDATPKKFPTNCTTNCTWEYAGKSDIEKWCTSDNPAERRLLMIDNYALADVVHSVFIVTPVEFKYGSPVPDGISSFFLVPFEMQTRAAVTV